MQRGNWIDERWCAAHGKNTFEPGVRFAQAESRGPWPRCTAADLESALEALELEQHVWRELGFVRRCERLERVLDDWQADGAGVDALARGLGLEARQLDGELEEALECGDRLLREARRAGVPAAGAQLVQVPADQMYVGLLRAVFPALIAGRPVLLLSDKDLPWLSQEFVAQLVRDEELGAALALLHDDRKVVQPLALEQPFVRGASLVGEGPDDDRDPQLQASSNSTFHVTREMDSVRAARRVARLAFDPIDQLSGQRDGSLGRVVCHERLFSRFTAALLDEVDRVAAEPGCRTFVADLAQHVDQLCRLGLDEGATLLRGAREDGPAARDLRRSGILPPTVFTNVEPDMGLARSTRPAPVLSILRADEKA